MVNLFRPTDIPSLNWPDKLRVLYSRRSTHRGHSMENIILFWFIIKVILPENQNVYVIATLSVSKYPMVRSKLFYSF